MSHVKSVTPAEPGGSEQERSTRTEHVQYESTIEPGEDLRLARMRVALDFAEEINRRWRKNQSCSRQLLADKFVRVNESVIRKWANGDKPIPLAALEMLPEDLAVALVKRIFARRGVKL